MTMTTPPRTGWRQRQPSAVLRAEAAAEAPGLPEETLPPDAAPNHWQELLAQRTVEYRLPAAVFERLLAEALTAALPEIALLIERQLRLQLRAEHRARLQSCDAY